MFIVPVTRESRNLSRLFDDGFDRFFGPVPTTGNAGRNVARSPALDVAESDLAYTAKLDVPGVAKQDLKVSVDGRVVTIQAKSERVEEQQEGSETARLVHRERAVASYARSFTLAREVDADAVVAKLENGVLTLTLPKRGARAAAQITIN